jgi:predicted RNA binding protein YcfA (HicA-like mRNA interferase family)
LTSVSGKELCKILERHGWLLMRVNGSHHIYAKPGLPTRLSVPVHRNAPLKVGLMRNLLKHAGLAEADLSD